MWESRQNAGLARHTDTLRSNSIHWPCLLLLPLGFLQGLVVGPDSGVGGIVEGVALEVCLDAVRQRKLVDAIHIAGVSNNSMTTQLM